MRKIKITYLLLLLSLASCTIFRISAIKQAITEMNNEKIVVYKNKSLDISYLASGHFYLPIKINGKKGKFLFDTGAALSVVYNKEFIAEFPKTDVNYHEMKLFKGSDRKIVDSKTFIADSCSSDLFASTKKRFVVLNKLSSQPSLCNFSAKMDGMIGNEMFYTSGVNHVSVVSLDFDKNQISTLDSNFNVDGYTKINSKMQSTKILLPLLIGGNSYWVGFDTGFTEYLHLNSKSIKKIKNNPEEYKAIISLVSRKPQTTSIKVFNDIDLEITDDINIKCRVDNYDGIKSNLIGLRLIKQFNWILDYKNETVYVKATQSYQDGLKENKTLPKYRVIENQKQLIISTKLITESKFEIGDVVTSINNKSVTTGNLCEMKKLLTETEDWSFLNIKVNHIDE